ncbi:hypothetical protein EGJ86_19480 [Pseudomonas sp. o96-267]|uniref:LPD1 domain-containing protein n=1 Tax=Pseudomonas sp. o96-267 TaxID=2479853 RepID=UPI000F774647|nr:MULTISPECIES: LPD1 domain-containing protein [Pseudomonas]MDH0959053.1 hypothetical protein [Pseudomonas chengduensis]MDV5863641.1 hypothetical protein [Pseudomonas mendocina]RRV31755.1 hypothetical protein EGJ86_19480 [Pseudomonas sp. o96-267]
MDEIPSVWGRHATALIDPIMVRGKLITSVMQAPEEWAPRLSSLGFRKSNEGWLKLGALKQSEYAFLSHEIDLVGMRNDDIHEAREREPDRVPLDVQDVLLRLWQRQTATVMVALSMEHDATHTRAEAWSFVEAALAGEVTPETETLYGLTLTKMTVGGGSLSADAEDFADALGWQRRGKSSLLPSNAGKLLFAKGESVEWITADGIQQSGRVARKVSVTDKGCWVIQAPRWAGGYAYSAPVWVDRTQLYFEHSAQDWANEQALEQLIPHADTSQTEGAGEADLAIPVTDEQEKLLLRYVRAHTATFPPIEGVEPLFTSLKEVESFGADGHIYSQENLEWLERVAAVMEGASRRQYGSLPMGFVIKSTLIDTEEGFKPGLSMSLAVTVGATREVNYNEESEAKILSGGLLHIGQAAKQVEQGRAFAEAELISSSAQLSQLANAGSPNSYVSSGFRVRSPMLWPKISDYLDKQITAEDVLRIQSVLVRGTFNELHRLGASSLADALHDGITIKNPDGAVHDVYVDVRGLTASLVDLNEVATALSAPGRLGHDWINNVPSIKVSLYDVEARMPEGAICPVPAGVPVKFTRSSRGDGERAIFQTPAEALSLYIKLLDAIEPIASSQDKLIQMRKVAENYDLYERLKLVPQKLREMGIADLRQAIKAQVFMQEAKRVSQMSEGGQDRMLDQIADTLRKAEGNQGVVCLFSSSRAGYKWRMVGVPVDAATLDQTRAVTMESAAVNFKNRMRVRGVGILIDGVAIADPDLANLLNGDGPAKLKESAPSTTQEGYQDTGVVAGLAAKDIRGMRRMELLDAAEQMSDQQKGKYITRELIWPRKSFEEMREAGIELKTAYVYDLFWKTLPKAPITASRQHVSAFINVISSMKEAVEPLLKEPFAPGNGELSFSEKIRAATSGVWLDLEHSTRSLYCRDVYARGYNRSLSWSDFTPHRSRKLITELAELSWSDVLKSKKRTAPASSGSKVVRGEIVRNGPDYRDGRSVTAEDFIRTFGFSGVEYGNWTNQAEREKHLNLAYDSMMDFARVMGWEPMSLSLGGRLGLCIGSRGKGGARAANAHFEPVNMAINLTRMRGDGALAHEYFHAVARHYGHLATGTPVDMTDTFGYLLQKDGALPSIQKSGLREEMQRAFQDLVVAIMRKPGDEDDYKDIQQYQQQSKMLLSSMAEDGASGNYWGTPHEMFARSMEIWFKDRLNDTGERNDYLVGAEKSPGSHPVYPDAEHLQRINHFVSPWLDAIKQEVAQVAHPFLGDLEMPVLNTEMRSVMPLSVDQLSALASVELKRLFAECAPSTLIVNDPVAKAGMYELARDLITLNASAADEGTFYHEAWHACHGKLLTSEERAGLSHVFAVDGPLAEKVEMLLVAKGADQHVIDHMRTDCQEVQAYAFQLWKEGQFRFDDFKSQEAHTFSRVGTFVEGVTGVGEYFGAAEAERLFTRFLSGDLAEARLSNAAGNPMELGDDWDSDNSTLYWEPAPDQSHARREFGMS